MVYILKDEMGKVAAVSAAENLAEGWFQVPDSDEGYLNFLETQLEAQSIFRKSGMVYILKDEKGKVVAASAIENLGLGWLQVQDSDEEYLNFLETQDEECLNLLQTQLEAQNNFRQSDIELARVLEDLISLLIERDVIHFTDFPEAAQKRLIQRQGLRMKGKNLNLLGDDIPME
jgi:hypothetical protein